MAQLALNQQISATTGVTPFFANFGKHPNLFMEPGSQHPNADKAMTTSGELKKLHEQLRQKILSSQDGLRQNRKKSKPDPQLKVGDKVYLLTKNLRSQRTTRKLDHVKVGPFLISEVRGPVNYKLQLPDDAKVHPVFHISLLEPADPETPLQTTFHFQTEEDDEFEVEQILGKQGQRYLVKWKGYPHSENTWEPKEHLTNCQTALQRFRHATRSRRHRS